MFSGPQIGDDFDPSQITRSEVTATLLGFATTTALGETQTTALTALTQAQGTSTLLNALDQRVSGELASKLEAGALTPYALQTGVTTAVTQLALDQVATNLAVQSAQNATSILQSSLQSSLALKADQSALEALTLQLQGVSSTESVLGALVPYSTTVQTNQSIAITKGAIESTAAATYATQQQVTQLSVEVAGNLSQAELTQALAIYSNTSQITAAISTATSVLEVQTQASLDSLQTTSNLHTTQLDGKASVASLLQLASDLGLEPLRNHDRTHGSSRCLDPGAIRHTIPWGHYGGARIPSFVVHYLEHHADPECAGSANSERPLTKSHAGDRK
jgi:hypothetical protein